MEWTSMMKALRNHGKKTILRVYWASGLIFDGFVDTISETTNCLDYDDPDLIEYYMCVFMITDVVQLSKTEPFIGEVGGLYELSELNEPIKIEVKEGEVIWQKHT